MICFITALMVMVLAVTARADNISDYSVNLYDYVYQDYSYKCGKSSHTHNSSCKHSYSYISSYSLNCGKEEHTHDSSCDRINNTVTYTTYTISCPHCNGSAASNKVGHDAWHCDVCGAGENYVGVSFAHVPGVCPGGATTTTKGTATHICKTRICTKAEHTHTGNSSSRGGCYGRLIIPPGRIIQTARMGTSIRILHHTDRTTQLIPITRTRNQSTGAVTV